MKSSTRQQTTDQASKGGIVGIVLYLFMKWDVDPALIAMSTPVLVGLLSWVSTKIGDPTLASFIGTVGIDDGKVVKVAAKKAVAKKAAPKHNATK